MLKLKKSITIIIFFIVIPTNIFAENKIAYLDIDFILSNTKIGKSLFKKIQKFESDKINELNDKEKILKDEENKILASKNIISKDELNKNINEFQIKLKNYKNLRLDEINLLKKKRNEDILNLLKSINPLIEKYMNDNSISILIDKKNIFIADKNFDITKNLIDLIDTNFQN
ncbi:OmpH family outer membrane protein [Candidatus Pelagibacter sp.]|nr:OmpH family outer membrane protein [Candidatus Pelagibacter sp.]